MGMDDSQWESASRLADLLQMLHQQREENINSERGAYVYAARSMYRWTFGVTNGSSYDRKRKCLWYLGQKVGYSAQDLQLITNQLPRGPEEPEDRELEVRRIYHIIQKGRYLSVYVDLRGLPSKWILKFDMLNPGHRQAFLDVRRLAVEKCPQKQHGVPAKHRELLRVQNSPRHQSRRRNTQQSTLGTAGRQRGAG
jgi:hypothetical protein